MPTYSFQTHTATSGQTDFSFAQIDGYLNTGDLDVFVNGVQVTSGYTVNTVTAEIEFAVGRTAGEKILIKRNTPVLESERVTDFTDGSVLTANDLDNSALQLLYISQEALDGVYNSITLDALLEHWDAESRRIKFVATPVDGTDAANKSYVDSAVFGSISGAANLVFATPNGTSGSTSLRALVAGDIPTITASKISDFDTQVRTNRLDQMAAPTASVSMNSRNITNLLDPSVAQDAATKNYCDNTFLNPDVEIYTSTYSSGSYTNTSAIVSNVGPSGFSRLRLNASLLPIRKMCYIDGIVGPYSGLNNGPHWFAIYNSTGFDMTFRILRAHFDWVANQSPWPGLSPQAPTPWANPWEYPDGYNPAGGPDPFTSGISDATAVITVGPGAYWKFYRDDSGTYWTGSYSGGDGECTVPSGGIGPAVTSMLYNNVRQGTYGRMLLHLIRLF
jgi:hypothetical protein